MTIKRYRMEAQAEFGQDAWAVEVECPKGAWVRYADLRREPVAIEAPAQKPVAWRVRERPGFDWRFIDGDPDRDPSLRWHEHQPLYATPPDHLALVAAAYRDAADKALNGNIETQGHQGMALEISCSTPADAEAHLTALLRAEYERGVRDTLAAADREAKGKVHIGGQAFRTVKLDDLEPAALALLTQEGR